MAYKIIILSALVAAANAGYLGAPITQTYGAPLTATYGAPIASYAAPLQRYAAPLAVARSPLTLASPVAHIASPYAAPIARYAAPLTVAAPIAKTVAVSGDDYDPNPQYSYAYDVQDALTGDSKSQSETRNGDVVQGSYSLVDPDGTRRTVEYTADSINGFNAVVHREPLVTKAVVAAPAYKTVVSAPAYSSPLGYAIH